jgi:hypothetical protein
MFCMYTDRKYHNRLMLELRRLKESGATTIGNSSGTTSSALEEARQMLKHDFSHLTGKERWYAEVDVALAKWALSVVAQNSNGHAKQKARVDSATRPTPPIHEDSAEPVFPEPDDTDLEATLGSMSQEEWTSIIRSEDLSTAERHVSSPSTGSAEESSADRPLLQELFGTQLTMDDLRKAVRSTERYYDMKDTISRGALSTVALQYQGPFNSIAKAWTDLTGALESNGCAIAEGKFTLQLTEQGKAWLNEASDSSATDETVGAQTVNHT